MSESKSSSSGIGFSGLLTVVFITLKLCGVSQVAAWSWWWVFSPMWISAALFLAIFAVCLLIAVLVK